MRWTRRGRGRRLGGDDGIAIVFVAMTLVVLLIFAALAIDAGTAYVSGRKMQNAADNAALAGAHQLDKYRSGTVTAASVLSAVTTTAIANGADSSLITCNVIQNKTGYPIVGPCDNSTGALDSSLAGGIEVNAGVSASTAFAGVIGFKKDPVARVAAATIQPLVGGVPPFFVCAAGSGSQTDLLLYNGSQINPPTSAPFDITTVPDPTVAWPAANFTVNPAAVNQTFHIHGPQVNQCGLGSASWKGLSNDLPIALPGVFVPYTGTKTGPTNVNVVGQPECGDLGQSGAPIGCVMLLPICPGSNYNTGSNAELYCVAWGEFQLTKDNNNLQDFKVLGLGGQAQGGGGGFGNPGTNQAKLIQLVL
jgi:hypothetical protein